MFDDFISPKVQATIIGDTIDSLSKSVITIDYEHHKGHDGEAFVVNDVQNISTTTVKWLIEIPSSKYSHMVINIYSQGELTTLITEGADRQTGTLLPTINRNRNSLNTSTLTVSRAPVSGTTDGTVILFNSRVGNTSAGGTNNTDGSGRNSNEFILKTNTKYIISATTYANIWVTLHLDWYENF